MFLVFHFWSTKSIIDVKHIQKFATSAPICIQVLQYKHYIKVLNKAKNEEKEKKHNIEKSSKQ